MTFAKYRGDPSRGGKTLYNGGLVNVHGVQGRGMVRRFVGDSDHVGLSITAGSLAVGKFNDCSWSILVTGDNR